MEPWRESRGWRRAKDAMQAAFVTSVLLLVVAGGQSPVLALAYATTGLLLMGLMAVTDRTRFIADERTVVVEQVQASNAAAAVDPGNAALLLLGMHPSQHGEGVPILPSAAAVQGGGTYGAVRSGPLVAAPPQAAGLDPLLRDMQHVVGDDVVRVT
jgi:hypothetical protein